MAASANKKNRSDPKRLVEVKLFKDNGKYRDPLFVSVNNYRAAIPRGIKVSIPYYVYKHIQEMSAQDEATAQLIAMQSGEFEAKTKSMGL